MIGILNIGLGNVQSIYNALYESGYDPIFINEPESLSELSHFILPGVGNFNAVIQRLDQLGFIDAIQQLIARGTPTLGICLGMQLLSKIGFEGGETKGLDIINAQVSALPSRKGFQLPHVGWNEVNFTNEHPIFEDIKDGRDFYFAHNYHVVCNNNENIIATTNYSDTFTCVIANKNAIGVQFHPEKSQKNGIKLLENFCEWDGCL